MSEVLAASFDSLPYRHGAIPETHPARLGAIARLLGWEAVAPDRCRVLEVGCAEGMNLLPLAERFPGSEFVGMDFAPAHIAAAERARAAAQLQNARFVCEDLRTFDPPGEKFDYVIAHGVYSWASAEVRDRLMAVCARALAPLGVAYVSYNVQPAGGLIGGLRAILSAELADAPDAVAHLTRLLPLLEKAFDGQSSPYAALMREVLADMRSRPPELLFHDEFEVVNEPVTFLEFIAHAERHDLHYLAEAHLASMPTEHLPPAARQVLAEIAPDFFHGQQLLDLLGNRRFRNSLLIQRPRPVVRELDAAVISLCAIKLHMQPQDGRIDLAPGVPLLLRGRHGFQLSVSVPAQKAFFAALCEVAPARMPFAAAWARAGALLRERGVTISQESGNLAVGVAKLFQNDQCDLLLLGAGEWLRSSATPSPTALMRHQARSGLHVTNCWHEVVELAEEERRWVAGDASIPYAAALIRTGLAV